MANEYLIDAISALGGISGLGALISALAAWHNSKELKPDHGNSLADIVKSQGHQIGEIRDDINTLRTDIRTNINHLWELINKDT